MVGVDAGLDHLLTLTEPVAGLTDEHGHVPNPRVLDQQLGRLCRLDRAISRCEQGSRNRKKLLARRARLHGRIAKTRALHLHRVTNILVARFSVIAIETLHVAGMNRKQRRLGRSFADAALGEAARQLGYKTSDRDTLLVPVGRFYPSSKTCSRRGTVKAKLPLSVRVFDCEHCGLVLDRDVNAARNIYREAARIIAQRMVDAQAHDDVAGLRPETQNADPRSCETTTPSGVEARIVRGRNRETPDTMVVSGV
jgi:putative transposase